MSSWARALMNALAGYAEVAEVDIANAAAQSEAADLGRKRLLGIFLPDSFEGAALTFQACDTIDGTYVDVLGDDGAAYEVAFTDPGYVPVDPLKFVGVQFLKVTSDSVMTGAATIKLNVG